MIFTPENCSTAATPKENKFLLRFALTQSIHDDVILASCYYTKRYQNLMAEDFFAGGNNDNENNAVYPIIGPHFINTD